MSEAQAAEYRSSEASGTGVGEPRGIGGWLLLVAFGQVVGPLSGLVILGRSYLDPEILKAFEQYPLASYGELVLYLVLLVLVISTAVLFFRKSRYFPRFYICELVAAGLIPALSTLWISVILSVQLGVPVLELLEPEPQELAQLGVAIVVALIWIPYTLKSRRVKNTFDGNPAASQTRLLRVVVFVIVAGGAGGLLAGLGHAIGRGVFSGQLVGGTVQIALGIWMWRGSDVARAILIVLYALGFVFALAVPVLTNERGWALLIFGGMALLIGACFWILAFSKRLRAELAINEARYRKPDPAMV
jgi:hypothetical protein